MKIEDDTCFIKHFARSDEEWVSLEHFLEVWEDGFSVDYYSIGSERIYYEDAAHSGINPNMIDGGTYIMKKQYLRWTKQIQQAKETAVKMLQQAATPRNRDLEVGDFILYTLEPDEDGFPDDYAYYGMRIVEIKDDSVLAKSVDIDKYYFDCDDEVHSFEWLEDIQNNSCFITAEAFMATHEYMRNFCRQLLDEIKSQVRTTEQM